MDQIAEMWAGALLDIALEDDELKKTKDELEEVVSAFDDEVIAFFESHKILREDKKRVIKELKVSQILKNFLCLLVDKGRMTHIKAIAEQFRHLYNAHYDIKEVKIKSARKLDAALKEKLLEAIKKKEGKDIDLKEEIDERLISGVKIMMDDKVIDISMQKKIQNMRKALLEESW